VRLPRAADLRRRRACHRTFCIGNVVVRVRTSRITRETVGEPGHATCFSRAPKGCLTTCGPDIPDRDDPVESGPREPGEILFGTYPVTGQAGKG